MALDKHLFCFGLGFTAHTLGRMLMAKGWQVSGTTRSPERAELLRGEGFDPVVTSQDFQQNPEDVQRVDARLKTVSHLLISIPPDRAEKNAGDPVLETFKMNLALKAAHIRWAGYLSTIGVYGEHHGAWIDENAALNPVTRRSVKRAEAEQEWLDFGKRSGIPVQIFRLPGIYGPGRNQMISLLKGKSRRLVKEGQVFNRIHVEDIARTLQIAMTDYTHGEIYNISDDEPAPPQDVVAYGARLLGMTPPPLVKFEEADLSPMAKSFYGECKRVRNDKIKQKLGVTLKYPTYREGLDSLLENAQSIKRGKTGST